VAANHFAQASSHAVTHHRAAECLLDAEAEAAQRQVIGTKKDGEVGTRAALPGTVNRVKLAAAHQTYASRKLLARPNGLLPPALCLITV
jgi:hypothetical protein